MTAKNEKLHTHNIYIHTYACGEDLWQRAQMEVLLMALPILMQMLIPICWCQCFWINIFACHIKRRNDTYSLTYHCVKSVKHGVFAAPYFPVFGRKVLLIWTHFIKCICFLHDPLVRSLSALLLMKTVWLMIIASSSKKSTSTKLSFYGNFLIKVWAIDWISIKEIPLCFSFPVVDTLRDSIKNRVLSGLCFNVFELIHTA